MNKKLTKAFLIIGFLTLPIISYGFPQLDIRLQGPDELTFNFEGASIQAPRSTQSGNIASLEESQRGQNKTWVARRKNDPSKNFKQELLEPQSNLNEENSFRVNFYKNKDKITNQAETITLKNQEITVGEYTINIRVEENNPGSPNVQYNVQMNARKNS